MRIALFALMALVPGVAVADTITTKDGVIHEGKVVRELERGYLFRNTAGATVVVPFDQVDDVNIPPAARLAPVEATEQSDFKLQALQAERLDLTLEQSGTSLFWPVTILVVGTTAFPLGVAYGPYDDRSLLLYGAGVTLLALGTTFLIVKIVTKVRLGRRIEEIERQIADLNRPRRPVAY